MALSASINTKTSGLARDAREIRNLNSDISKTQSRLQNPLGATSGGGGRGGFKGSLKDFFLRDEFVGRTGTVSRLAMSGNVIGTLLALQSIEELFRNWTQWASGDKSFREVLDNQIRFLVPSIFLEQVPELLKIYGFISDQERAQEQIVKNLQDALKPGNVVLGGGAQRFELVGGRGGQYGGQLPTEADAQRWRNSESFRRRMNESSGRGVRR